MGVGSLAGSLTLAFMGSRRPMLRLIVLGGSGFVVLEVLFGLIRDPLPAYLVILLIGFASMLMVNTINVMIQNTVSNELRGRVMSLYVMVFAGSAPIGGFFAGAVAELWGAPAGFLLGALFSSFFVLLVAWQLGIRVPGRARLAAAGAVAPPDEDPGDRPAAAAGA